jgi:FAD/FMN-containing dehydrogenase
MSAPASPAVAHRATKGKTQQYSEATWPDPTALPHASPQVDDVSRLNATEVERVFEVRTPDDVKVVLRRASEEGRQVSVRGTQHSMGGHTIAPGGYVLDMRHFDRLAYDPATELVSAGTGAHWTDLIYYLNQFGLSPRTMQSYSSFSVGGTVSVNAHGITTDHCLAESIESFTLITADARELVCSRTASDEDARELFSLAIGGYGLFGIITEVTLKVNPNLHLELDLLRVAPKDFGRVYRSLLAADPDQGGDVDIKMARLDITNLEHIELYVFRRASSVKTVSPLDLTPREMSLSSRLIYKWLAPTLQELRFTVERTLGTAFDWSQTNDRNGLMYESAVPLARLYSPLLHIDDTFILQEYFVPQKSFLRWVEQVKPIYRRIAQHPLVSLLNTTIRFVRQDTETALAYARSPEGVYAFVLYYRIRRTTEADEALRHFHEELTEVTLSVHGTFYLPYRHHYSFDQLEQAYGRQTLLSFLERKEKYDPGCLFSSLWLRKYGSAYASDAYRKLILSAKSVSRSSVPPVMPVKSSLGSADASFEVPLVSERRKDSYRRLFHNALLRRRFLEEFLVHVFNIEDPSTLFRLISQAVWEPDNATDLDVYSHLQAALVTYRITIFDELASPSVHSAHFVLMSCCCCAVADVPQGKCWAAQYDEEDVAAAEAVTRPKGGDCP